MNKSLINSDEQLVKLAIIETKELIADLRVKSVKLAADIKAQRAALKALNIDLRAFHPPRTKR